MYQFLDELECKALVNLTLTNLGHPELKSQVPVEFSNRMTSTMGYAYKKKGKGIKLSKPLFLKATKSERMETIIHEVCHIVQFVEFPKSKPHGHEWKSLMIKLGLSPKRCHSIDVTEFKKKRGSVTVTCGCRNFEFGKVKYRRMKAGTKYHCLKCKGNIRDL